MIKRLSGWDFDSCQVTSQYKSTIFLSQYSSSHKTHNFSYLRWKTNWYNYDWCLYCLYVKSAALLWMSISQAIPLEPTYYSLHARERDSMRWLLRSELNGHPLSGQFLKFKDKQLLWCQGKLIWYYQYEKLSIVGLLFYK